jgi:DUF2924 family protein
MSREGKGRQRDAAGRLAINSIEAELSSLSELTIYDLRVAWRERLGCESPAIRSSNVLLRLLAWRIQAEAFGGHDAPTERKLREVARALERNGTYEPKIRRDLSPGIVLTREWKGVTHRIDVTGDGFRHQGRSYRSLSDVARAITGTRWSGPRFFGLEQKTDRLVQGKAS